MTLIIFKYCLPALLGYTLFVGIAGRLNPLRKPEQPAERPSWLLGLWTGLSVSLVLAIGLHMAYGMSMEGAKLLIRPTGWLLLTLLTPGILGYFIYRNSVNKMLAAETKPSFDWALESDDLELADKMDADLAQDHLLDPGLEPHILDGMDIPAAENEAADACITTTEMDQIDTEEHAEAINDSAVNTPQSATEAIPRIEKTTANTVEVEAEADVDVKVEAVAEAEAEADVEVEVEVEAVEVEAEAEAEAEAVEVEVEAEAEAEVITFDPVTTIQADNPEEQTANSTAEEPTCASTDADLPDHAKNLAELQTLYIGEQALREETEMHLRITRKALGTIEAQTRHYESRKADAVIKLEDKLTDSLKTQSAMEARATREKTKRINIETSIVNLKQDLVKAKQEVRRSIAARAKALSTANKSIAFARQNVQIRARLESEIGELQDTLKNRQTTISSLIRALEKEKRRTQDDVATMAKQLVLHEKQVKARRSLEEVAKSVEMKLSTRLVKKVARARPLISDS